MTTILTLRLDESSQAFFEGLRRAHFPSERNLISAHVTLFHTLPQGRLVAAELSDEAAATMRFPAAVTGLRSLGRGVAYTLHAAELLALHGRLAARFAEHLTAQDRQRFMPHIVVQNKTTAEAARALLQELQRGFAPRVVEALGLDWWEYQGGPWRHLESLEFRASEDASA